MNKEQCKLSPITTYINIIIKYNELVLEVSERYCLLYTNKGIKIVHVLI